MSLRATVEVDVDAETDSRRMVLTVRDLSDPADPRLLMEQELLTDQQSGGEGVPLLHLTEGVDGHLVQNGYKRDGEFSVGVDYFGAWLAAVVVHA
jgi:hypothetical protein